MNESNPIPPQIPPQHPYGIPPVLTAAPGENPEDRVPITSPVTAIEAILRQPKRVMYHLRQPGPGRLMFYCLLIALLCAVIYGFVVGTFSGKEQLWIAPVKVAGGMLFSTLICLPSLYIFACLSGSHARLAEVCGLVLAMLMLTTILLIGFAPVAWLFSQSTDSANWMGALHLLFWFIAVIFGIRFLNTAFSFSQARSDAGFNTWVVIFLLVTVQMTTALRPIVGDPKKPATSFFPTKKEFFLSYWGECLTQEPEKPSSGLER